MQTVKEKITEAIRANYDKGGKPLRTDTLPLNGKHISIPVISIPTSWLTLNKDNHRIKSQIEDAKMTGNLPNGIDFNSHDGQKFIARMLADTPDFRRIKGELKDQRQKEPALISISGLLSNGNTRCVALRELEKAGETWAADMDVAVIDKDLSQEQLLDIEIELQMVENKRQDYSFTNRLIMFDKMRNQGKSFEEIARRIGRPRSKKKIEKELGIYEIIKEIRLLIKNYWIKGEIFDKWETHLGDLYDKFIVLDPEDAQAAANLKYNRILGLFLGLSKDQVRNIDENIFADLLEDFQGNEDSKGVSKLLEKNIIQGDDELLIDNDNSSIDGMGILRHFLCQKDLFDKNTHDLNESKISEDFVKIRKVLQAETDRITKEKRAKSRDQELSLTMQNIRRDIQDVKEKLPERILNKYFNEGKFKLEIKNAIKELERLREEFQKHKRK